MVPSRPVGWPKAENIWRGQPTPWVGQLPQVTAKSMILPFPLLFVGCTDSLLKCSLWFEPLFQVSLKITYPKKAHLDLVTDLFWSKNVTIQKKCHIFLFYFIFIEFMKSERSLTSFSTFENCTIFVYGRRIFQVLLLLQWSLRADGLKSKLVRTFLENLISSTWVRWPCKVAWWCCEVR